MTYSMILQIKKEVYFAAGNPELFCTVVSEVSSFEKIKIGNGQFCLQEIYLTPEG